MTQTIAAKTEQTVAWHGLQADDLFQRLDTDPHTGLSSDEARHRLETHGPNQLTPARGIGPIKRLSLQFHQPLIYVLLGATAVTLVLQHWVDAAVIFVIVLINAVVGFIQEYRAERTIEALTQMMTTQFNVRRDRKRQRVPSTDLVPGDVVLLESGDRVPADLRLFRSRNLQIDESALTGESVPVHKHVDPVALHAILAERANTAYAGTMVTRGRGEGVVWATGDRTEAGRIAELTAKANELATPLTRKIARFSRLLTVLILVFCALTFLLGLWRGQEVPVMFMAAIALAVSAIPEGLPVAVTITLAVGVAKMARRRAIVRRLPAVEALGSTTVIFTDKTGTLTQNRMTVQQVFAGGRLLQIDPIDNDGVARIKEDEKQVELGSDAALRECLIAGVLCTEAEIAGTRSKPTVTGDPTEAALIHAALAGGVDHHALDTALPRLDVIPFESENQFMATLHHAGPEAPVIYKKGAVERILKRCDTMLNADGKQVPIDLAATHEAAQAMAARGLRVLAFAQGSGVADQTQLEHEHVTHGLTFLGLQGMMDPPRPEATEAVRRCREAGVIVKMVTGDHALTAQAIARQMSVGADPPSVMTGDELAKCPASELPATATQTDIFARVAPEQKISLVRALQSQGEVVAMTGDGVNDAPALRQADIGVAMGAGGTEVAKSAADIVLTDDNFASIEAAVQQGRNIYDNLTKFIVWTLPTNGGEAAILLAAILIGTALPAAPVQILWINMTTALLLGTTLVFEPKEPNLMRRPPRPPKAPLLSFAVFMRTGLVSMITLIGAFGLFLWALRVEETSLAVAQTIAVNTIVMVEACYLLSCRSLTRSMFRIGLFTNRWVPLGIAAMAFAQLLYTYSPFMNRLFGSAPITASMWLAISGVGLSAYIIVGFEKWLRFRPNLTLQADNTKERS
jgi:magnesium-transporting ATPase (P-type)